MNIAGLEWMGSRVFDPASHGFLSVDPLAPVTGAAWASNPYSYAGNDPLHAVDPLGLRPVTDEELGAYADGLQGPLAQAWNAAGDWISENRDYLIGGAMVVAGGVLMATGVGGPAGMMLMAAGADTIVQKVTTGEVNWGEVVISGVLGGFTGIGVAGKLGLTGLKATVAAGVVSGSASGSATGAYHYATGPGPHTVQGFIGATTTSGLLGGLTGGAGAPSVMVSPLWATIFSEECTPRQNCRPSTAEIVDPLALSSLAALSRVVLRRILWLMPRTTRRPFMCRHPQSRLLLWTLRRHHRATGAGYMRHRCQLTRMP